MGVQNQQFLRQTGGGRHELCLQDRTTLLENLPSLSSCIKGKAASLEGCLHDSGVIHS